MMTFQICDVTGCTEVVLCPELELCPLTGFFFGLLKANLAIYPLCAAELMGYPVHLQKPTSFFIFCFLVKWQP